MKKEAQKEIEFDKSIKNSYWKDHECLNGKIGTILFVRSLDAQWYDGYCSRCKKHFFKKTKERLNEKRF